MASKNSFKWKNEYSVGIEEIDRQHKEIISLIADMTRLCVIDSKESYKTFQLMLLSAIEYFHNHFWEEEKYMQERNYPAYPDHKECHEKMLKKIKEMANSLSRDDNITIKSITAYLREWYENHIVQEDKAMGEYFSQTPG
jgi:hemerythrin